MDEEPSIVEPSAHEYVPPPLAVKLMLVVLHVNIVVFGNEMEALGVAVF